MSKIADANYTLKATAEEGEAFQVLGVGDSESRLPLCFVLFFFLPLLLSSRGLSQVLETNSGQGEDTGVDVLFTSQPRRPCSPAKAPLF